MLLPNPLPENVLKELSKIGAKNSVEISQVISAKEVSLFVKGRNCASVLSDLNQSLIEISHLTVPDDWISPVYQKQK